MTQVPHGRPRALKRSAARVAALAAEVPLLSRSTGMTDPSDLADRPWRLRSMEVSGTPSFVDNPDRFTVEFQIDASLGVVADRNQCGGSYSVGDGTLRVRPLACTLILCPTPRGEQLVGLLQATSAIGREGIGWR